MSDFAASAHALSATVFGMAGQAHMDQRQPLRAETGVETGYADLDGDGRTDRVTPRAVDGAMDEQTPTLRVGGRRLTATVPSSLIVGTQPMRVVDVDADGREEVIVTEVTRVPNGGVMSGDISVMAIAERVRHERESESATGAGPDHRGTPAGDPERADRVFPETGGGARAVVSWAGGSRPGPVPRVTASNRAVT